MVRIRVLYRGYTKKDGGDRVDEMVETKITE